MKNATIATLAAMLLLAAAPLAAQAASEPRGTDAVAATAEPASLAPPYRARTAADTWQPELPADPSRPAVLRAVGARRASPSKTGAAIGALVGGMGGVVLGVTYVESCDKCDRSIAPALAVGAVGALGGALVGWVIGKLAEPIPPDPAPGG